MNDSQIVELFWGRKESAIQEAQDRYGVYCAAIASHILNNREDVEECVSDAFLCAWNTIPPQRPELLSAFLGKLTRRYALRKLRENLAQKRGGGSVPEPFEEMENTLSANMDLDQILEAMDLSALINDPFSLRRAILTLSPPGKAHTGPKGASYAEHFDRE